ncbi:MAG: hypothetical protein NXI31_18200 [bacterium]|nr:hypothetical protein [bacterium]
MNTPLPAHEQVAERHLDLMITERLARDSAPDVSLRTVTALEGSRQQPRRLWPRVACVLFGLAIVLVIANEVREDRSQPAQQPALGPVVTVRTIDEIEQLPADADNVRVELHSADAVRRLARLRQLRRLDVSYEVPDASPWHDAKRPAFFPEAADWIGMLTSLEELDISGHGPITGLERLATLSRLRRLRIFHALIDPACLAVLKRLPKLEDLTLDAVLTLDRDAPWIDMRHPEHGVPSFAGTGRLRRLTLSACIVDAAAMKVIAQNPLQRLELYGLHRKQKSEDPDNALPASAYVPLARIATLRELVFGETVSPELVAGLHELPHLTSLDLTAADGLEGSAIGAAIAKLPHLTRLEVDGSFIDSAALLALTDATNLVDLGLGGDAQCTDAILAEVCAMPNLRHLRMPDAPGFTAAGMAPLRDTALESLRMVWAPKVTPAWLLHLPKSLRAMEVHGHMLDAEVLAHLANVSSWSIHLDSRLMMPLVKELLDSPVAHHIEQLRLAGDVRVLDSLAPLADLPKLHTLDLRECDGEIPREDLALLREHVRQVMIPGSHPGLDTRVTGQLKIVDPPDGGK